MAKSGEPRTVAAMFGAALDASRPSAKRPRHSSVSGSSFAECPVCFRPFHPALIQSHAAECADAGCASPEDARRKTPPEADPRPASRDSHRDVSNATPTSHARPDPEPALAETPKRRNGRDAVSRAAFASLMDAQKSAKCELVFCAWLDARGAWRWTLERGTAPGPRRVPRASTTPRPRGARPRSSRRGPRTASPARRRCGWSPSAAPEDTAAAAALAATWAGRRARQLVARRAQVRGAEGCAPGRVRPGAQVRAGAPARAARGVPAQAGGDRRGGRHGAPRDAAARLVHGGAEQGYCSAPPRAMPSRASPRNSPRVTSRTPSATRTREATRTRSDADPLRNLARRARA